MKRTLIFYFLTTLLLSPIVQIYAQTEKRKFLIGGGSSLEYASYSSKHKTTSGGGDDGKTRYLDIIGQVGYFVFNKFVTGLEVPYSYTKEIAADEGHDYSYINSSITLIPFLRCYLGKSNIKPYLHGGIGPGWGKTKYFEDSGEKVKVPTKISAYEIGGGLGIFLNEFFSIDLGLGYVLASEKWLDKYTNMNYKSTSRGLGISIGIVVCM